MQGRKGQKTKPLVFEFTNYIIMDIQLSIPEQKSDKDMKDYCCSQPNLCTTATQYFIGLQLYQKCASEKGNRARTSV